MRRCGSYSYLSDVAGLAEAARTVCTAVVRRATARTATPLNRNVAAPIEVPPGDLEITAATKRVDRGAAGRYRPPLL